MSEENFWIMVQREINRGRHIDHLAGCHSIRTNQCPHPPSPYFFTGRMPFLPPNQQRQSTEGNSMRTEVIEIYMLDNHKPIHNVILHRYSTTYYMSDTPPCSVKFPRNGELHKLYQCTIAQPTVSKQSRLLKALNPTTKEKIIHWPQSSSLDPLTDTSCTLHSDH